MFGQPRCREWTPLATQQLRLRNLIQIVGYNIRPPDNVGTPCSYYYSLHITTMSAPFYTSERVQSTHPKWREIDSETLRRMSCGNVVVRLWRRFHPIGGKEPSCESSLTHNDVILETWGIYFSGLLHVGANLALDFTPNTFKPNTLVFQMHGGFFCPYESFRSEKPSVARAQAKSTPKNGGSHTSQGIPIERRSRFSKRTLVESKSHSPRKAVWQNDNLLSRSQSPPLSGFTRSSGNEDETLKHSASSSLSSGSGPISASSKEDLLLEEGTQPTLHLQDKPIAKSRYSQVRFLKSEIRPSYNATKLQKLHLLQYSIKKQKEAVSGVKLRINQKSAINNPPGAAAAVTMNGDCDCRLEHDGICDDVCSRYGTVRTSLRVNLFSLMEQSPDAKDDLLGSKPANRSRRTHKEDVYMPGDRKFTLSLNKLLEIKSQPSPGQRLEYTRLTKQQEIMRFKRKLLSEERDTKMSSIRRLKDVKNKLLEENQDLGSELMQGYHSLSKNAERLKKKKQSNSALDKLHGWTAISTEALRQRHLSLLMDIYDLQHNHHASLPTICGIPLAPCSDEDAHQAGQIASETAAAAGYAAMLTRSAAILLCKPLRYDIKALGSRSKIVDPHTPTLIDRDIPLFTRNRDSSLFRYGLFLLNKDIAQLLWSRGKSVYDIRPTLSNLALLLSPVAFTPRTLGLLSWCQSGSAPIFSCEQMSEELSCLVEGGRHVAHSLKSLRNMSVHEYARRFNRFKDCIDGQSPSAAAKTHYSHRHSRSVGSYQDEQSLQEMEVTSSMMGSEPSLLLFDLQLSSSCEADTTPGSHHSFVPSVTPQQPCLEGHSAQIELQYTQRADNPEVVKFTLGDDLSSSILVRMSSNNGDMKLDSNLRLDGGSGENLGDICSKIGDLLDESKMSFELVESISTPTESFGLIEKCKENMLEGDSSVLHDVIVIQSAEAKIDTGSVICCGSCDTQNELRTDHSTDAEIISLALENVKVVDNCDKTEKQQHLEIDAMS